MISDASFGTCCACGKDDGTVRNLIALPLQAPEPGTGWGCMVCRAPMDGALTVVCDRCLEAEREIKWVIRGPVWLGERIEKSLLRTPFDHDQSQHDKNNKN